MSFRWFLIFILFFPLTTWAQFPNPKIEVGPGRISMNDQLKITVTVYGPSYTLDDFPEIGGFEKGNRTVKHGETQIDGKKVETHSIIKFYSPIEGGDFIIQPFEIEINSKLFKSELTKVTVENDEEGYAEITEDIDDVELVTECSKKEIFVGEGVKVRISFYLSGKNTGGWQFSDDIGAQVENLAKRVKPENSLESRNVISSIQQRVEYIKGAKFMVYDIFEAVYYPLNDHDIQIPALTLKMKKGDRQTGSLTSKPQTIQVKNLPNHPLKDKVPVGTFRLKEYFQGNSKKITGESFDYRLTVEGQANMEVVSFGKINSNENLDFFESSFRTEEQGGKLAGVKVMSFKILPKKAGEYKMADYFSMVYFDIKTAQYDTLRATSKFIVDGETILTKNSLVKDIYSGIDTLRTDKNELNFRRVLKTFANFIWVFMVMLLIYIWKRQ